MRRSLSLVIKIYLADTGQNAELVVLRILVHRASLHVLLRMLGTLRLQLPTDSSIRKLRIHPTSELWGSLELGQAFQRSSARQQRRINIYIPYQIRHLTMNLGHRCRARFLVFSGGIPLHVPQTKRRFIGPCPSPRDYSTC